MDLADFGVVHQDVQVSQPAPEHAQGAHLEQGGGGALLKDIPAKHGTLSDLQHMY